YTSRLDRWLIRQAQGTWDDLDVASQLPAGHGRFGGCGKVRFEKLECCGQRIAFFSGDELRLIMCGGQEGRRRSWSSSHGTAVTIPARSSTSTWQTAYWHRVT